MKMDFTVCISPRPAAGVFFACGVVLELVSPTCLPQHQGVPARTGSRKLRMRASGSPWCRKVCQESRCERRRGARQDAAGQDMLNGTFLAEFGGESRHRQLQGRTDHLILPIHLQAIEHHVRVGIGGGGGDDIERAVGAGASLV